MVAKVGGCVLNAFTNDSLSLNRRNYAIIVCCIRCKRHLYCGSTDPGDPIDAVANKTSTAYCNTRPSFVTCRHANYPPRDHSYRRGPPYRRHDPCHDRFSCVPHPRRSAVAWNGEVEIFLSSYLTPVLFQTNDLTACRRATRRRSTANRRR